MSSAEVVILGLSERCERCGEREKEEAALTWGIPVDYCWRDWTPGQRPISFMASVFDGNSLGKYIFDWTVCFHGGGTPMADLAGEFWILLISLTERLRMKVWRGVSTGLDLKETRRLATVIGDGEFLWMLLLGLVRDCEPFVFEQVERGGDSVRVGRAFLESLLGRDCYLARTEGLMHQIRVWVKDLEYGH